MPWIVSCSSADHFLDRHPVLSRASQNPVSSWIFTFPKEVHQYKLISKHLISTTVWVEEIWRKKSLAEKHSRGYMPNKWYINWKEENVRNTTKIEHKLEKLQSRRIYSIYILHKGNSNRHSVTKNRANNVSCKDLEHKRKIPWNHLWSLSFSII